MANNRISILVALEGADDGLKRAVASAEKSLGELSKEARTAGEKAQAGLAQVKAGVAAFGEQFGRAKTQLIAFFAAFEFAGKLREIVEIADAWNMMNARLKLATAGQREFSAAQKELFAIAQRIGVPLQETASLYGKLQQAVRMLGMEQKDAFTLTESISQALRVSGASAEESKAALLQFGQALSAGVLRGEEFNSVIENSPRLAQALADGLNVPIGRLRKMAEEGRLTADVVVQALLSQKERLATEYASMPVTVSQAMERVKNAFGQWVHKLDESTGFTKKLADALTWLSQNMDTVMKWLTIIKDVGLAVLIYRFLPALVTAWQTAGAAAVVAANAMRGAWAAANLSVSGAIASVGLLKTSFAGLGAFLIGWEIGTWLSNKFEVVREAGIFMVRMLLTGFERLRYVWEAFAALFTSDTLADATKRHRERMMEMNAIFADMAAGAAKGADAAKGAMTTAAATAEEIAKRLEAVRQGTQEAVGRGVETVHAALEKLKSRLGEVEQMASKANQTVNDAVAKMGEAYKTLTGIVEANFQRQFDAVKDHYQQQQTALELGQASQAILIAKSTQLLIESLSQQTELRRQASAESLRLIDAETGARIEAARREGQNEEERRANVIRVENEILAAKRQTLNEGLQATTRHIDALNAEANRHLAEIKRIEEEKRALSQTTDERIRELQRSAMSSYEAYQDKLTQAADLQEKARSALREGEFDKAKEYAKKAQELAAQTANAVKDGDKDVVSQKEAVQRAIESMRASEELAIKALEGEGKAHQQAASDAVSARGKMEEALRQTQAQIDAITAKLKEGLKITLDADTTRLDKALIALDKALAEKERLLPIKADLEQAEKKLAQFEQLLKDGKTLPVDADVSKAKESLAKLTQYAKDTSELELKVSTEKAQAAIANVDGQLKALDRIQTESKHLVGTNASAARSEIQSLNGMNTSSTHTITVKKVEANATGGLVGGVRHFSTGGAVAPAFPRMAGGKVPGSGHHDTVPRTLVAGAFVVRKAAVQKYGAGSLSKLANGIARFATGGLAAFGSNTAGKLGSGADGGPTQPTASKRNREAAEALKTIELGMQGMNEYVGWLEHNRGAAVSLDFRSRTMNSYGRQAERDRAKIATFIGRRQLTGDERQELDQIKETWRHAMAQPLLWGKDLERDLIDYMEEHQGEFYRHGGVNKSDTVPAMLTPGEYVVNKAAVDRYGAGFFEAINNLSMPAKALARKVQGFATGGLVQSAAGMAARASSAVKRLPTADLGSVVMESLAAAMRIPTPAYAADAAAPTRTIRVELASGNRAVAATVDTRDEARLLELLKEAQSRAL